MDKKKVVIVGGGFGGLTVASTLSKKTFDVLLLDAKNHHTFQPFLYQIPMCGMEPSAVAFPIRKLVRGFSHCAFQMGRVESINPERKRIKTQDGLISYDILILATGAKPNYFGLEQIKESAYELKSAEQALALREAILSRYESAQVHADPEKLKSLLSFVIIGGGPTGVELAGALCELQHKILTRDYPHLDERFMQVHLVEKQGRLLASMSKKASRKAKEYLERCGVKVYLSRGAEDYDGKQLTLDNGDSIPAGTLVWAAGVSGNAVCGVPENLLSRQNRIKVDSYMRLKGLQDIYAIGDLAAMTPAQDKEGAYPMLAPVAIQQAKQLAENLNREAKEKKPKPFHYKDHGTMAAIGRFFAVVDMSWGTFSGRLAWLIWAIVHVAALMTFREKVRTFVTWAWFYFNYDRSWRIILHARDDSGNQRAKELKTLWEHHALEK